MTKFLLPLLLIFILSCKEEVNVIDTSVTAKNVIESSLENNSEFIEINNKYYKHFPASDGTKDVILKVNQIEKINKKSRVSESSFIIEPFNNNIDWEINTSANEFEVINNTIIIKDNIDLNYEETFSLYNLLNGEHLLDYTYGKLTAKIMDSDFKRFIGFTSLSNSKKLLQNYDKNVVGVLSYTSDKNILQKIIIKSNENLGKLTPDMEMVSLNENHKLFEDKRVLYFWDLPDFKQSDINFAFGLIFYIGEESNESAILFEVKNDKISLLDTKYDKNVFTLKIE